MLLRVSNHLKLNQILIAPHISDRELPSYSEERNEREEHPRMLEKFSRK